jgi:hypothetical protein
MLAADVPYLEIDWWIGRGEFDGCDVLADGGHGFEVRVRRRVGGFDLFEERGFAGVVEAEEEDGVFCVVGVSWGEWVDGEEVADLLYLWRGGIWI